MLKYITLPVKEYSFRILLAVISKTVSFSDHFDIPIYLNSLSYGNYPPLPKVSP